jgi:hypothetical protein
LVTGLDGLSTWIINGSFIKVGSSVVLGLNWGWELIYNHFQESFSSIDPLLEDVLEKKFSSQFLLFCFKINFKMSEHFPNSIEVSLHDVSAESDDWFHNELDEASLELSSIISIVINLPLLGLLIKEVISPELLHHLIEVYLEFI